MLVIDMETNTNKRGDVIELSILKTVKDGDGFFRVVDFLHRYYYSKEPVCSHTLSVHNLTPEIISNKRDLSDDLYADYYSSDTDIHAFCDGERTIVAHNVSFEKRHLETHFIYPEQFFCTMKENKHELKLKRNGRLKMPSLKETCLYYGIDFDDELYHSALYDTKKPSRL